MRNSYPANSKRAAALVNAATLIAGALFVLLPASAHATFSFGYNGNGVHVGVARHGTHLSIGHSGYRGQFSLKLQTPIW
jgi:hypothetical protein